VLVDRLLSCPTARLGDVPLWHSAGSALLLLHDAAADRQGALSQNAGRGAPGADLCRLPLPDLVAITLFVLGLFTVLLPVYLFFRPVKPVAALSEEDEKRIREVLARHGSRDSLGYFSLRRDKSVIWSPSGKACIAYRVLHGVMLASGDPAG